MGKFLKNWGGLIVAIVALLASVSAVYYDNTHYEETQIREEERDRRANEEFKQSLEHQKELDEEQNIRHKELVQLQQKRYNEQIRQHEEAMNLAQTALGIERQHYQELSEQFEEVIEPKTRHDEIFDFILLLYDRLVLYRDWLTAASYGCREVAEPYYIEASNYFHYAEEELRARNFDEAQRFVTAAYTSMSKGYQACESVVSSNTTTGVD